MIPLHTGTQHTTIRGVKMITFQNVTKHYGNGSVVVDGLNFGSAGRQNYGICRPFGLWKNHLIADDQPLSGAVIGPNPA